MGNLAMMLTVREAKKGGGKGEALPRRLGQPLGSEMPKGNEARRQTSKRSEVKRVRAESET